MVKVLVLGGYGVFGGRLCRLLLQAGHAVVVAGRSGAKAQAFCAEFGGEAAVVQRDEAASVAAALDRHRPDLVVDAAGPFQAYGRNPYRLAQQVITTGIAYADLSDDAAFTAGIGALDALARENGVFALSGLSSVPAISAAAVRAMAGDMERIDTISAAILPGNRAPRGGSVMRAILRQVGAPLQLWRGGRWQSVAGWSGQRRYTFAPGDHRYAALIGAPDLRLFPQRFAARSVLFRAGLELPLLHWGLAALGLLRRWRLLPRLDRLATPIGWVAARLERFGSDTGGMIVEVIGVTSEGTTRRRRWTMRIGEGQGPFVPAVPAAVIAGRMADIASGARPTLDDLQLDEVEAVLTGLGATTEIEDEAATLLFQRALADDWPTMPAAWQQMHSVFDCAVATGRADITRGQHRLARLVAALMRFPPAGQDVPVEVEMTKISGGEIWRRRFGRRTFRSRLRYLGSGRVSEQFGPLTFDLTLPVTGGRMGMQVSKGRFLGLIPLPRWMLPVSETYEFVDKGKFQFDVRISHPLIGLIVHYRGWLVPGPDGDPSLP